MLLTRAQAADRAALLDAQSTVLSGEPPSMARLADWSSRSSQTRDDLHVVPVASGGTTPGTAEYAYGVFLARFGQPDDASRAVPPTTMEQLREIIGGTFEPSDPEQLARARALAPGASVLVSFKQSPTGPEVVASLHVAEDSSGDVQVEPKLEDLFGVDGDEAQDRLAAVLSDPSTQALAVDRDRRPTTLAQLAGRATPPRRVAPEVMNSGQTFREAFGLPPVPLTNNLIVAMNHDGGVPEIIADDPARLIPRSWPEVRAMLTYFERNWADLAQETNDRLDADRQADPTVLGTAKASVAAVKPVTSPSNVPMVDTPDQRDRIQNFVRAYSFATLRVKDALGANSPLPSVRSAFGLPAAPAPASADAGRPAAPGRSETDVLDETLRREVTERVSPGSLLGRIKDALEPLDGAMSRFSDQLPDSPRKQQIQDGWNEFRTDAAGLPEDATSRQVKDLLQRYSDLRSGSAALATREKIAAPLPRRIFLVADLAAVLPDIQAQVQHKVADARFLTDVFKSLMNDRVVKHRLEKFPVVKDYYRIRHEMHEIEDLANELQQLYVQPGMGLVAGRKFLAEVPARLARFTTESTKLVGRAQERIEWIATKLVVDATDSKLRQQLAVAMNIANSAGSALSVGLLPTGFSWAPATVTFATDLARLAVLSGVKHSQTKKFQADTSIDAVYQIHSDNPLTRARAQAQQAKDYFKLLLEAIEIGANVWPAWPTLQALINTAFNEFVDARVRAAADEIAGRPKPTALKTVDGLWKSFLTESKEKFTDAGAWKTVTEGIKGQATEFGITGSFASVLAKPLAEKILDYLPLKPAATMTGEHLRHLVDNVGSLSGADTVRPQPTFAPPVPSESIPDDVLRQDRYGRRVYDYRSAGSNEKRAHVALNFYGSLVWGKLERNGNFTPERPDVSSYVDEDTVQGRIISKNSYTENGNEVRGTWYKPFAKTNDYLFVRDRDGSWEWFHEMSVPAQGKTGRNNIHNVLSADEHREWIAREPFDWNPPANSRLIVDFDGNRPILDNQAHQLAWYMAHRVLEGLGGRPGDRPRLHIEAGALGSRKRAQASELKQSLGRSDVSNPKADAISRERAGNLRAEFFRLLDRQLKAQADERNIAVADLPHVNELLAAPIARGAGLWRSDAPEALQAEARKLNTHSNRRTVSLTDSADLAFVWIPQLLSDDNARPEWFDQAVKHLEPSGAVPTGGKPVAGTTTPTPAARRLDPAGPAQRGGRPASRATSPAPATAGPARPVQDTAKSVADDTASEAWQYLLVSKVPLDRELVKLIKGAVEPLDSAVKRAVEALPASPDRTAMGAAWTGFKNDVQFLEPDSASIGSVLNSYAHTYALWTEVARNRDVANPLPRTLTLVAGYAGELVTATAQVERKIGDGRFLKGVMREVPRNSLFRDHPMDRFQALAAYGQARHELHKVEDYAASLRLLYGSSREGVPDAKKVIEDFVDVMEDFTKTTTKLSGETQQTIEWLAASANAGATETDLKKKVGLWMNVLNSGLSGMSVALAPTGWGWAPATTTLLTDLARTAVMRAVEVADAKRQQGDKSAAAIFLVHDEDPLTVARAHYQTAKTMFRLTLEAIEVGAHVWPAWPLVPGVLGPMFDKWIDERLAEAERQLKGLPKPAAEEIMKRGWKGFIEETKAKFSDAGFWKTATEQAAKGGATPFGWAGSLVSQLAKPLLGAVLEALPIKPAFTVTGKEMMALVDKLGSLSTADNVRPEPTKAKPRAPQPIPDQLVGGQDRYGRQIQAYRPAKTGEQGDLVALNFHGSLIWGKFDKNGTFQPEQVDPSSKVDAATLQKRTLTRNSYIESGAVEVRGTWHQPFKGMQNEFDYLFVRDSDGGWEWFPAMGVTGGGTNKYSHVHVILSDDKHDKWVSTEPFQWHPPAAGHSIIDFGTGDEPQLSPQSHELLADIARKVIERKEIEKAGGPVPAMPQVHLEAGAIGSSLIGYLSELKQRFGRTELDNPEALEDSQRRAANLRDQVTHLLDRQLEAFADERGLTSDEFDQLPKATDLVAESHARGAGLFHSKATDNLKAVAVARTTHSHRETESLADSSNLGFIWTKKYAPVTGNRSIASVLADVYTADDESIRQLTEGLRALLSQSEPEIEARFGDDAPARWKQFVASVGSLDPTKRASVFAAVNAYDFARTAVNRSSNLTLPDVGQVVSAGLGFEGTAGQDVLQVNMLRLPDSSRTVQDRIGQAGPDRLSALADLLRTDVRAWRESLGSSVAPDADGPLATAWRGLNRMIDGLDDSAVRLNAVMVGYTHVRNLSAPAPGEDPNPALPPPGSLLDAAGLPERRSSSRRRDTPESDAGPAPKRNRRRQPAAEPTNIPYAEVLTDPKKMTSLQLVRRWNFDNHHIDSLDDTVTPKLVKTFEDAHSLERGSFTLGRDDDGRTVVRPDESLIARSAAARAAALQGRTSAAPRLRASGLPPEATHTPYREVLEDPWLVESKAALIRQWGLDNRHFTDKRHILTKTLIGDFEKAHFLPPGTIIYAGKGPVSLNPALVDTNREQRAAALESAETLPVPKAYAVPMGRTPAAARTNTPYQQVLEEPSITTLALIRRWGLDNNHLQAKTSTVSDALIRSYETAHRLPPESVTPDNTRPEKVAVDPASITASEPQRQHALQFEATRELPLRAIPAAPGRPGTNTPYRQVLADPSITTLALIRHWAHANNQLQATTTHLSPRLIRRYEAAHHLPLRSVNYDKDSESKVSLDLAAIAAAEPQRQQAGQAADLLDVPMRPAPFGPKTHVPYRQVLENPSITTLALVRRWGLDNNHLRPQTSNVSPALIRAYEAAHHLPPGSVTYDRTSPTKVSLDQASIDATEQQRLQTVRSGETMPTPAHRLPRPADATDLPYREILADPTRTTPALIQQWGVDNNFLEDAGPVLPRDLVDYFEDAHRLPRNSILLNHPEAGQILFDHALIGTTLVERSEAEQFGLSLEGRLPAAGAGQLQYPAFGQLPDFGMDFGLDLNLGFDPNLGLGFDPNLDFDLGFDPNLGLGFDPNLDFDLGFDPSFALGIEPVAGGDLGIALSGFRVSEADPGVGPSSGATSGPNPELPDGQPAEPDPLAGPFAAHSWQARLSNAGQQELDQLRHLLVRSLAGWDDRLARSEQSPELWQHWQDVISATRAMEGASSAEAGTAARVLAAYERVLQHAQVDGAGPPVVHSLLTEANIGPDVPFQEILWNPGLANPIVVTRWAENLGLLDVQPPELISRFEAAHHLPSGSFTAVPTPNGPAVVLDPDLIAGTAPARYGHAGTKMSLSDVYDPRRMGTQLPYREVLEDPERITPDLIRSWAIDTGRAMADMPERQVVSGPIVGFFELAHLLPAGSIVIGSDGADVTVRFNDRLIESSADARRTYPGDTLAYDESPSRGLGQQRGAGETAAPEPTGPAVQAVRHVAQSIRSAAGGPSPSASRLRQLFGATAPEHAGDMSYSDSVLRSYLIFPAYQGRAGNLPGLTEVHPPTLNLGDVERVLNGKLEPLTDVEALRDWLMDSPGAMALLQPPPVNGEPSHPFWLWSKSDEWRTLGWIDARDPDLIDLEAFAEEDDPRAVAIDQPGVKALRLDPGGKPLPPLPAVPAILNAVHAADDDAIGRLVTGLQGLTADLGPIIGARFGGQGPAQWRWFTSSMSRIDPAVRGSVMAAVNAYDMAYTALRELLPDMALPHIGQMVADALDVDALPGTDPVQVNILQLPDHRFVIDSSQLYNHDRLRRLVSQEGSVLAALANDEQTYVLDSWDRLPEELFGIAVYLEEEAMRRRQGAAGPSRSGPSGRSQGLTELDFGDSDDERGRGAGSSTRPANRRPESVQRAPRPRLTEEEREADRRAKTKSGWDRYQDRRDLENTHQEVPADLQRRIRRPHPASDLTEKGLLRRQKQGQYRADSKLRIDLESRDVPQEEWPERARRKREMPAEDVERTPAQLEALERERQRKWRERERNRLEDVRADVPENLQRQKPWGLRSSGPARAADPEPRREVDVADLVERSSTMTSQQRSRARASIIGAGLTIPPELEKRARTRPERSGVRPEIDVADLVRRAPTMTSQQRSVARALLEEAVLDVPPVLQRRGQARPDSDLDSDELSKRENARQRDERRRVRRRLEAAHEEVPPDLQRRQAGPSQPMTEAERKARKREQDAQAGKDFRERERRRKAGEPIPPELEPKKRGRPRKALPVTEGGASVPGGASGSVPTVAGPSVSRPPVQARFSPTSHDDLYDDPPPRRRGPAPSLPSVTNDFQALSVSEPTAMPPFGAQSGFGPPPGSMPAFMGAPPQLYPHRPPQHAPYTAPVIYPQQALDPYAYVPPPGFAQQAYGQPPNQFGQPPNQFGQPPNQFGQPGMQPGPGANVFTRP
ncbi:hypothetical protein ACGFIO_43020, partial [Actinoplanes sp. NPDC049265]